MLSALAAAVLQQELWNFSICSSKGLWEGGIKAGGGWGGENVSVFSADNVPLDFVMKCQSKVDNRVGRKHSGNSKVYLKE